MMCRLLTLETLVYIIHILDHLSLRIGRLCLARLDCLLGRDRAATTTTHSRQRYILYEFIVMTQAIRSVF